MSLERELAIVKDFWLHGIGKIMAAPHGATVQILRQDVRLSDNDTATPVRVTKDENARDPITQFQQAHASLMVLTRHNDTARSLCALFGRQLPIWEGHTRYGLEILVKGVVAGKGDPSKLASAVVEFMASVGKGFSPSQFEPV
jgi:hypothetical protein